MVWDNEKDEYLCREVLLFEPYLHKPRTVARAVRERFGGLVKRFKAKNREELVATDVSPEQSQLDVALEEIIQKMDGA